MLLQGLVNRRVQPGIGKLSVLRQPDLFGRAERNREGEALADLFFGLEDLGSWRRGVELSAELFH